MSKNPNRLILPSQFNEIIRENSTILLDTNVLLNLGIQNTAHLELFELMNKKNCTYVTSDLCYLEFIKGSDSRKEMDIKEKLFTDFDIIVLPTSNLRQEFEFVVSLYRRSGKDISIADIALGSLLKKYIDAKNFYLLTEDVGDFWESLFERKIIVNISEEKHIQNLIFCTLKKEESSLKSQRF